MRMTFNMWIKKQKDIYGELQNQQYDSPKKQWEFFDNRINCVLGTARHSEQSYEGFKKIRIAGIIARRKKRQKGDANI